MDPDEIAGKVKGTTMHFTLIGLWDDIDCHHGYYGLSFLTIKEFVQLHLNSLVLEFHSSTSYQHMTKLGHRNVWCLRCFGYLECWLHRNWVAYMCPAILWSPTYACTVPYCSGSLHTAVSYLCTFLHVTLYSVMWVYYLFCIGCASTDTRRTVPWDYWFSTAVFPKGSLP